MSRPRQIAFLSRTAGAYDTVVRTLGFTRLWDAVAGLGAPRGGEPCLDVCTGTGGVALALAGRGARVLGLDLAPGMLARARHKARRAGLDGAARFARADARALALPDGAYPLVTCSMALHEMAEAERRRVLAELSRVGSGRVLVADYRVPASRLGGAWFRVSRAFEYLESDDFAGYVGRDFAARLAAAGLEPRAYRDVGAYRIWACRPEGRRPAQVGSARVAGATPASPPEPAAAEGPAAAPDGGAP